MREPRLAASDCGSGDRGRPVRSLCVAALLGVLLTGPVHAQRTDVAGVTAFVDVAVVPMDRERVLAHQTVLVRDGRIERIGRAGAVAVPADAVRVNGRGRYLIPGLSDMHVHFGGDRADNEALAKLFVVNGVTTVFGLSGVPEHLALRNAFESGQALGPRIYTSGRFINEPFFHTPEEVEREVVAQKRAGYDYIKMHGDMSREAYARLIKVAAREGIRVVGHAPRNLGIDVLLEERQYGVVHLEEFMYAHFGHHPVNNPKPLQEMDRGIEALARRVAKTGTWVTPTLVTYLTITEQIEDLESVLQRAPVRYVPPRVLTRWRRPENTYVKRYRPEAGPPFRQAYLFQTRLLKAFHQAGVPLLAGTDAPIPSVVPGFSLHQELQIMVDAGVPPYAALKAATRNPAEFFAILKESGTIEQGKRADLVLLDGNPLEDIAATTGIAGVMLRGVWLARERLDALLDEVVVYASSPAAAPRSEPQGAPASARVPAPPPAQNAHPAVVQYDLLNRARDALNAGRWEQAADLFGRLAASDPGTGSFWMDYARAAARAGRDAEALRAFERAYEIGFGATRPFVAKEIAVLLLRRGDREAALTWLERGIESRWRDRSELLRDTALAPLRNDPRFRELAGALPDRSFTRDEGWRYDLDYLVSEARRLHKDVARPAFSAEFDATARRLRERIPQLSDAEIIIEMRRLLTLLNDGHARIQRGAGATQLPLDLYLFSDGLYVVGASAEARDLLGSRVLAFGPLPTERLFKELEALVPRDSPMGVEWMGPRYVTDPVVLKVLGATSDTTAVELTLRDRTGSERRVTIRPVPETPESPWLRKLQPPFSTPDTTALFLQRMQDSFWLKHLPELEAVYFQYNQVRPTQGEETVAEFADRLQRTLGQTGARNLIVDVRHNSGGNSYTFPPLVRVMAWFRQAAPGHQIYMVIGRNTFSAAQNFTNITSTLIQPLFVGEPTGSKPMFVGESGGFRLPYSGVVANVSFRTHQGTIWDDDAIWVAPDVPAPLSSEDYFADRDPALDAIRALILARRPRS